MTVKVMGRRFLQLAFCRGITIKNSKAREKPEYWKYYGKENCRPGSPLATFLPHYFGRLYPKARSLGSTLTTALPSVTIVPSWFVHQVLSLMSPRVILMKHSTSA